MREVEREAWEQQKAQETELQPLEKEERRQRERDNRRYLDDFVADLQERGIPPLRLFRENRKSSWTGAGYIVSRPNTTSLFPEFRFREDRVPGLLVTTKGEMLDYSGLTMHAIYLGFGDEPAIYVASRQRKLIACRSSELRQKLAYALNVHKAGGFAHSGQYPYAGA